MDPSAIASALHPIVAELRKNPSLIHHQSLAFFKQYLLSLGAKLPATPADQDDDETDDDMPDLEDEVGHSSSRTNVKEESEEEEEEKEESEEEEEEEDPDDQLMPRYYLHSFLFF